MITLKRCESIDTRTRIEEQFAATNDAIIIVILPIFLPILLNNSPTFQSLTVRLSSVLRQIPLVGGFIFRKKCFILKLPPKLLSRIFSLLSLSSKVCFAITCKFLDRFGYIREHEELAFPYIQTDHRGWEHFKPECRAREEFTATGSLEGSLVALPLLRRVSKTTSEHRISRFDSRCAAGRKPLHV